MRMLLPPLAAAMGLLALIYFLILACMKKITVLEWREELEVLRRIGFPVRTVRAAVSQRFAVPVILGSAAAVFPAIYGLPRLLSPLAQQLGLVQFPIYPSPLLTGEALLAVLICSLASSRAAMGRGTGESANL